MIARGEQWVESFLLVGTDGLPNTIATPLVLGAKDTGDFVELTNSPVRRYFGEDATAAWYIVLTADEMDSDLTELYVTASGCIPQQIKINPDGVWTAARAGFLDAAISNVQTDIADARDAVLARFAQAVLAPVSPISPTGQITLYRGIDYAVLVGNEIEFALPAATHGDLTDADIVLQTPRYEIEAEVVNGGTASQCARIELTAAETAALVVGEYEYALLVTLGSGLMPAPKAAGTLVIVDLPQPVATPST